MVQKIKAFARHPFNGPGSKTRPPIHRALSPSATVVVTPEMSGNSPREEACPHHAPKQFTFVAKKHGKGFTSWQMD